MNNIVNIKTAIDKKDLEAFSQALMNQVVKLQVENEKLKEKVEHLEELLKNVPMGKTSSGILTGYRGNTVGIASGFLSGQDSQQSLDRTTQTNNPTGFGIIGAAPSSKDADDLIWTDRDIPQETLDEWYPEQVGNGENPKND